MRLFGQIARRVWFGAIASMFAVTGCGDTTVIAGPADSTETTNPTLDAVLEPMNAVVDDFGPGWEPVDRWFTEGPEVEWTTDCGPFNDLDVFARSGPDTSVWRSESAVMVHRVQSLESETAAYAGAVAVVAEACPTITAEGPTVTLTTIDAGAAFGHDGEDISVSAIGFDSFPIASREADLSTPIFDPNRPTWQVTLVRYNTVSQVIYSPTAASVVGFDDPPEELRQVVGQAWEELSAAPVEATGPFEQSGPPPTPGDQVVHDVVLRLGFDCFENSAISVGGIVFRLIDPLPEDWLGLIEVRGSATIEGELATFVAEDGTTLRLSSGATESSCTFWESMEMPNPPDTDTGRLDCGRPAADLIESRHADTGQGPDALAAAEIPGTVALEQENPLIWWAVDAEGTVLAGIFLGDADGADYQIFRCPD